MSSRPLGPALGAVPVLTSRGRFSPTDGSTEAPAGPQPAGQGAGRRPGTKSPEPASHPSGGTGPDPPPRPPDPAARPAHRKALPTDLCPSECTPAVRTEPAWALARAGSLPTAQRAEGSRRGGAPGAGGRQDDPCPAERPAQQPRAALGHEDHGWRPPESRQPPPDKSDAWGRQAAGVPRGLCGRGRGCPRAYSSSEPKLPSRPQARGKRGTATPPRPAPTNAGGRVGGAACERHRCASLVWQEGAAEDRRTPTGRDADNPAGHSGHSGPDLTAWTSTPRPHPWRHGSSPTVPGTPTAAVSLGDRPPARRRGPPGALSQNAAERSEGAVALTRRTRAPRRDPPFLPLPPPFSCTLPQPATVPPCAVTATATPRAQRRRQRSVWQTLC